MIQCPACGQLMMPVMVEALGRVDYCHWCEREFQVPPREGGQDNVPDNPVYKFPMGEKDAA